MAWEALEVAVQAYLPGENFATGLAGVAVSLAMEPVPVVPQEVNRHQPLLPPALLSLALAAGPAPPLHLPGVEVFIVGRGAASGSPDSKGL